LEKALEIKQKVCLHDLVNVKNSKYAFRYSNILDVPQVKTTRYGKKSFMFMKVWNIVNLLNLSKYRPKRLSIFSCCDAFLQIELIKKLEKVHERALRFVYDDYTSSYINLLEKALVPSLQIRRIKSLLPNRKYLKFIWISLHFVNFKPINKNIWLWF
jgi:hypothetical protein